MSLAEVTKSMIDVLNKMVPTVNRSGIVYRLWYVYRIVVAITQHRSDAQKPYFIIFFIFVSKDLNLFIIWRIIISTPNINDNMLKEKKQM